MQNLLFVSEYVIQFVSMFKSISSLSIHDSILISLTTSGKVKIRSLYDSMLTWDVALRKILELLCTIVDTSFSFKFKDIEVSNLEIGFKKFFKKLSLFI